MKLIHFKLASPTTVEGKSIAINPDAVEFVQPRTHVTTEIQLKSKFVISVAEKFETVVAMLSA